MGTPLWNINTLQNKSVSVGIFTGLLQSCPKSRTILVQKLYFNTKKKEKKKIILLPLSSGWGSWGLNSTSIKKIMFFLLLALVIMSIEKKVPSNRSFRYQENDVPHFCIFVLFVNFCHIFSVFRNPRWWGGLVKPARDISVNRHFFQLTWSLLKTTIGH